MSSKKKDAEIYDGIVTQGNLEFGGPWGVLALMIWSHYILFYFWYCYESNNGQIVIPLSASDLSYHLGNFSAEFMAKCIPGTITTLAYISFFVMQLVLAAFVPGMLMYGLPTAPSGERLPYLCNGYWCYYICIYVCVVAHFFGFYHFTHIADNFGEYLTAAVVVGDVTSLYWYVYGIVTSTDLQRASHTGNPVYDFFMGTVLYPRFGIVDIKMVAEVRWSWLTLFLLTASCAVKQYETVGYVSKEMCLMLYAHWLYSNATVKGEHCIPCTWDMFHENFGWMLNFWNIAGVPYLYCFQSFYILKNQEALTQQLPVWFNVCVFVLLTVGYYIFDSANCQKASIKIKGLKRNTFPQVPWAVLEEPIRYIHTPKGDLLVGGWYAFVRKLQYTGDIVMALCWGLVCGFTSPLPYFYCLFFTCMICHRQWRDEIRCKAKYGEYWDVYTKEVPNVFLPGPKFFKWLLSEDKALPPIVLPKGIKIN